MKKRGVGERATILFDSIDLAILRKVMHSYDDHYHFTGQGILELAQSLNIKHKNLKPHIDKLRNLDLIFVFKTSDGKVSLGAGMRNIEGLTPSEFDTEKDYEEALEQAEKEKAFVNFLEKAESYQYDVEIDKQINYDFRKKAEYSKPINYTKEFNRIKRNEKIADAVNKERKELSRRK